MRGMIFPAALAALFIVLVGSLGAACAEMLDHHGTTAESEGTTAYCLTCHDGTSAKKVAVCTAQCTIKAHKSLFKYPPPGRDKDFAPLQAVLAAGVKFEDGLVTCISCHDLRNQEKYQFAIDSTPFAQKLCYACHVEIY